MHRIRLLAALIAWTTVAGCDALASLGPRRALACAAPRADTLVDTAARPIVARLDIACGDHRHRR